MPAETLFYHLTTRPLEAALPELLEKTLARGWRAVLRARSPERVARLNGWLWTWREDSFLPHGTAEDGHAARQPIYLTARDEAPNDPQVLFLVDGADWTEGEHVRLARVVVLFDGNDPEAVEIARGQFRRAVDAGARATYWAQTPQGGWAKKAERGGG